MSTSEAPLATSKEASLDGVRGRGTAWFCERFHSRICEGVIVFAESERSSATQAVHSRVMHVYRGPVVDEGVERDDSLVVMLTDYVTEPDGGARAHFLATGAPQRG